MRLKRFTVDFTLTFYELNRWNERYFSSSGTRSFTHIYWIPSVNSTFCIHLWEPPLVDQQSRLLTVEPYYYQRQLVATKRGPSLHLYSIIASKLSRNITSTHAATFRCYLHRVQLVLCELLLWNHKAFLFDIFFLNYFQLY